MQTTDDYVENFAPDWAEIQRTTKELAHTVLEKAPLEKTQWKGIIAITRGGMVPACIIARELKILTIETFCITSYDDKDQSETKILKMPQSVDNDGEGWLVIDDLVDTGKTFELARKTLPKAHYACLYVKPKGAEQADNYITQFAQDTWIEFPWEI